ncbi:hypothetical protein U1Q18_047717 [Sarracenia purpurea var. burkii]
MESRHLPLILPGSYSSSSPTPSPSHLPSHILFPPPSPLRPNRELNLALSRHCPPSTPPSSVMAPSPSAILFFFYFILLSVTTTVAGWEYTNFAPPPI